MNYLSRSNQSPIQPEGATRWKTTLAILFLGLAALGGYVGWEEFQRNAAEEEAAQKERQVAAERARIDAKRKSSTNASQRKPKAAEKSAAVDSSEEMIRTAIGMLGDQDEDAREGARLYLGEVGRKALPYLEETIRESRSKNPQLYKEANRVYRQIVDREDP